MPWIFCDDISNGSGVIALMDKETDRHIHTDRQTLLKTVRPSLRGWHKCGKNKEEICLHSFPISLQSVQWSNNAEYRTRNQNFSCGFTVWNSHSLGSFANLVSYAYARINRMTTIHPGGGNDALRRWRLYGDGKGQFIVCGVHCKSRLQAGKCVHFREIHQDIALSRSVT